MPPAKTRVAQDDSSTSSRQAPGNVGLNGKGKKPATTAQTFVRVAKEKDKEDASAQNGQTSSSGINWASADLDTLNKYRTAHKMETPPAFSSFFNQCILTSPGLAQHSPTMVARARREGNAKVSKDRKVKEARISRDELAKAVRKNFNDSSVNEVDVAANLIYKVHNQDKAFRLRTRPMISK